jgi:MFS family permease
MSNGEPDDKLTSGGTYAWYVVAVLMFAYMVAFVDRQILSLLVQPIKRDLGVSDTQIGLLAGFAFAIFYSVLGVPIARLADRTNRKYLIAVGVLLWSLMTALCGLTKSYWQLFLTRVGVGVGEATLSPAAYSMMADYFPPNRLARAIGVYAMGLYIGAGVALLTGSAVVSLVSEAGSVTYPIVGTLYPWQLTFFVVALPGLLVLALLATVKEPPRREVSAAGDSRVVTSESVPVAEILNFLSTNRRMVLAHLLGFLSLGTVISAYLIWVPEFLRRTHDFSIPEAGVIYGLCLLFFGGAGPYVGGWFAEFLSRKGYRDAEMRASMMLGLIMIPLASLAPLAPGRVSAVVMLALATFILSAPQGLAPTIIQLMAPNRMRAQITALFMLIAVLAGFSAGPYFVAFFTDYVFADESAINYSMAIVSAVLTPVGTLCLWYGMKPYAERGQPSA